MSPVLLLTIYCFLILLVSLAGGWIPLLVRLTHRRMQVVVSLVAGVMLGVGLLHLLPHAVMEAPDAVQNVFLFVLVGFLVMFFTERFFCFHHHDVPGDHDDQEEGAEQAENCPHVRSESHELTWSGAAVGLSLHTVLADVALAASVEVDSHAGRATALAGLGTFLVIFLHKPFDSMTISALMTLGGWSTAARHLVNGLFALMIPVGVGLFHLGLGQLDSAGHVIAYALAFSAGTFLCIAMSDLLPELQFHSHDRGWLSAALVLGLSLAWAIGLIEARGHSHDHGAPAGVESHEGHDHDSL